jgi:dethiobiotin synthetase/adenosylmethionine--8-amino-7-oxononanoate aminotransferase
MLQRSNFKLHHPLRLAAAKYKANRLLSTSASNLQVMIFGSSTDVGKTITSAGICRAALSRARKVCYIKPVQTGELDEYFVGLYTNPQGIHDMFLRTLHHWSTSTSPHLASRVDPQNGPVSDVNLLLGLNREMRAFSNSDAAQVNSKPLFTVVETAGGTLSPGPSKNLQADIYRSLRLPVILVGDAKLGGITTTLSAYESLRLRGYTVHAIVMIQHSGTQYGNLEMIRDHLERSLSSLGANKSPVMEKWTVNSVPKVFGMSPLPTEKLLHQWYKDNANNFGALFDHLAAAAREETVRLMAMRRAGKDIVWWPFTQHAAVGEGDITFIESAHGDQFRVVQPVAHPARPVSESDPVLAATSAFQDIEGEGSLYAEKAEEAESEVVINDLFDGCGSWWTQGIGHGNPFMSLAIAEAAGRFGHVMFPSNLHPPAVQLAQYLLEKGPGRDWAQRVFYSDDGSTGMEVAIKMAMRLWEVRKPVQDLSNEEASQGRMRNIFVLTQRDCYHGDTLGTMDTAESGPFNRSQHPWYRPRSVALPVPLVAYQNGRLNVNASAMSAGCNIGIS